MEGEWSCYRSGQFNGGKMVMLQRWSLQWKQNGHMHVIEVASLNGGRIVMLHRQLV